MLLGANVRSHLLPPPPSLRHKTSLRRPLFPFSRQCHYIPRISTASVTLLHAFNLVYCKSNKAIVDIRLRPLSSAAPGGSCLSIRRSVKSRCPLFSHFEYTLLSCRQFLTVTCKYEVIHKPKVYKYRNAVHGTKSRRQHAQELVKIGRAVQRTDIQTYRHTNRHGHHNTSPPRPRAE